MAVLDLTERHGRWSWKAHSQLKTLALVCGLWFMTTSNPSTSCVSAVRKSTHAGGWHPLPYCRWHIVHFRVLWRTN
jgi:hypothetical protein